MEKVVIDGATGMIGLAIIDACIRHGVKTIYAVARKDSKNLARLPNHNSIHIIECNADSYNTLTEKIFEKCEIYFHAAWTVTGKNRNEDILGQEENIAYTLSAIKTAKDLGCTKFIGAGSQAEYGLLDKEKISPNSPVNPIQPYGIAKYAAGKLGSEYAKQLDIEFIWVRIFSVFGEYDKSTTMISSSISKLLDGQRASFTAGDQRWDYLYSRDAGEAFYYIGERAKGNKVYCLGSGKARLLKDLIIAMRDIVNPKADLGIGDIPYTGKEVMNLCADISQLTLDTGWKPSVSFEEGIKEIIDKRRNKS